MAQLRLDESGQDVLVAWFLTHPPLDDIVLVEDVIEAYAAGEAIHWHTARDLFTGDLIVSPREGLAIVIRRFSDDDPEYQFTLVAVDPDPAEGET